MKCAEMLLSLLVRGSGVPCAPALRRGVLLVTRTSVWGRGHQSQLPCACVAV